MFGFFSSKKVVAFAPVKGRVLDITEVPDAVFSQKMMGDGIAVEPESNTVVAPCNGKIVLISSTKHAIAIESDGVEFLIHIGLDTVELGGRGFEVHVTAGSSVKQGEPLITFDKDYILAQEKPLITMMVITNMAEKVKSVDKHLSDSLGKVLTVAVK